MVGASVHLRDLTRAQRSLIEGYDLRDPEAELLGFHRGRPVVYTYLDPEDSVYREHAKRHVVVIQRDGQPGDLGENWEEHFVFLPAGVDSGTRRRPPGAPTVRAVITDWLSWSIRS